jgi:membrane-associated phospholipid phosphatase
VSQSDEALQTPAAAISVGRRVKLQAQEVALLALGIAVTAALAIRGAAGALQTLLATMLYGAAIWALASRSGALVDRVRLLGTYPFAAWFYESIAWMARELGAPSADGRLLQLDRVLFGETPAALLSRYPSPWATELMSAAYLAYQPLVHLTLLLVLFRTLEQSRRLYALVFCTFAAGFTLYLLVPAVGPETFAPQLFPLALPQGLFARFNTALVAQGGAVYDTFPSLHVALTLVMAVELARRGRLLALSMAVLVPLIVLSTLYLRYHYGVDLLAGALLFAGIEFGLRRSAAFEGG